MENNKEIPDKIKKIPKVFAIILNYNGKDVIQKTLGGVFRLDYPNFEVILVDNNSTDGSFEVVKNSFSKIILIKNSENMGFSAGNNVGISYALERGADYILLLNYDTLVEKDFLSFLVREMEKDKKIGIGSPMILEGNTSRVWFSGGEIQWLRMKTDHKTKKLEENYFGSDYISGCAMLIRKDVFKKTGLLDEDYFLYWEDADFCLKTRKAGYRLLICPQSRIWHFEKSEEKNKIKTYWLVLSGLIFFKKNSPFWLRPWFFFYVLARRIKNWTDVRFHKNTLTCQVKKAYQDFHVR